MKEFIDKLIERLEELQQCQIEKYTKSLDEGNLACIYDKTDIEDAKVGAVWKVLDIVTQLAEEYKDNVIIDGQYCWQTCSATEHCKECNRLFNGSIDYYENYDVLAEEYKVSEMPTGWIACSERLPEDGVKVLCYGSNALGRMRYEVSCYSHKLRWWKCSVITDVFAWMPLPAPYTEGE